MDSLIRYISRIHRSGNVYRERLVNIGLSGFQHVYILEVCHHPGISQERLARHICVNKSNVTRQLSALEQAGFITRSPSPDDKRVLQVFPTQKAESAYPQVCALMAEWNRRLLEDFTEEERTCLMSMLERAMGKAIQIIEEEDSGKGGS